MKNKLISNIKLRVLTEIDTRATVKFLKDVSPDDMVNTTINILYTFSRGRGDSSNLLLSEIICAVGRQVRKNAGFKADSAAAAKAGAFILYTFEKFGLVHLTKGKGADKHAQYFVVIDLPDEIDRLWNTLTIEKINKFPYLAPPEDWITTTNSEGYKLVKTADPAPLSMTAESHPMVFKVVNDAQKVGWGVNPVMLAVGAWALRNKTEAFNEIWELIDTEAKSSKVRETKTIIDMATKLKAFTFYHRYYYDFRCRKYPATAYLHEQGSDLAKGLLLREKGLILGERGFFWLLVSIASNWGGDAGREDGLKTDKIPLKDRFDWVLDNEEIFLDYAESPKVNQGWMKADKPWQFLSNCMELMKLRIWQMAHKVWIEAGSLKEFDFVSNIVGYIDGSNNGSQHLAALTLDEVTAPHVNLVPMSVPGDLYKYVAKYVWENIERDYALLTRVELHDLNELIDITIDLRKNIQMAQYGTDERKIAVAALKQFKAENKEGLKAAAPIFWRRITSDKEKRKIVKRNVMTLPYGGTPYGLGSQQNDDARKHGIAILTYLEVSWGAYMGRLVFETCKEALKRPMQLLSIFEQAGKNAEEAGEFLKWIVPVTNFPVVQHYTEGEVKRVYVQYGPPNGERVSQETYPNMLQLHICFIEKHIMSKRKQAQGASPNAIHSLDAAHLLMTVDMCDFPVTTIHDSYGCLLADMDKLFINVRRAFIDLYKADPLTSIMKDIGGDITNVEFGTLDLELVAESEFCFV